jgi:hypothetical protein
MGSGWRTLADLPADTLAELEAAMARAGERMRGEVYGFLGLGADAAKPTHQRLVERERRWLMELHYTVDFGGDPLGAVLASRTHLEVWWSGRRLEDVVEAVVAAYPEPS